MAWFSDPPPILSEANPFLKSRFPPKWEVGLDAYYHPVWVWCSGLCCDNKQPRIWVTYHPQNVFLAQHLSLGRRTAPHCSGSSVILELHQLEYVFLDLLFCALFLNGHISLLPPVHWLQLVNGKGVGRYWVIGRVRVSAINHFELCRLGVLSYFLILSTVHTECMLIPQKLN